MDLILNTNINAFTHLIDNHFFYSFILCSIAIIWFVIRLHQHCTSVELLRYQYGQLAWSLSNTVIVVIACSPIIRTIFEGIIWAPSSDRFITQENMGRIHRKCSLYGTIWLLV